MSESAALRRYLDSMRRRRIRYAAVVTVVVRRARGVRRPSSGRAARPRTSRCTPSRARRRTSPLAAAGAPSSNSRGSTGPAGDRHPAAGRHGRHVLGAHRRGRNARTGATTWSYTRTDRTVCTAAQLDGTTIAIYAVHGNCDEVTALDSGTGRRTWTRTLDKDGMPLNGRPTYAWSTRATTRSC